MVVAVAQVHLVTHTNLLQYLPDHSQLEREEKNYLSSPGILIKCLHFYDSIIVSGTGCTQGVHWVDIMD